MLILVDADACPVKEEIYRVARRHGVPVRIVANNWFRVPREPLIEQVVVGDGFDAADDWIAARAEAAAVVITGDILLAARCVTAGATVLHHNGKPYDAASIGPALAGRAAAEQARATAGYDGIGSGGPRPFTPADRSAFLQALDGALVRLKRAVRP